MLYRTVVRPALFVLDAERAHELALHATAVLARSPILCRAVRSILARPAPKPVECLGLTFPNPVGLAAGMDKNGLAPLAWWALGFGFVELGTVTPRPQPGNDRPRMFRFPAERALVNRMGFNNDGAGALAERLAGVARRGCRPPFPVGVSVGKNKDTPPEKAAADFAAAAAAVVAHADFVTVNVSSPNTPGLRALQNAADVRTLVTAVKAAAGAKPVLVKIAPELAGDDLAAVLDTALAAGVAGVIATNTLSTAARPELPQGGLSGRPLKSLVLERIKQVRKRIGNRVALIGCGGVEDASSAQALLDAGANLVQLYTALVYDGPFIPARIARGLR